MIELIFYCFSEDAQEFALEIRANYFIKIPGKLIAIAICKLCLVVDIKGDEG